MKTRNYVLTLVACSLALALGANAMAQEVKPGTARVVRIKGAARYSVGNNIWQELKVGMVLNPGAIIQTAADSFADLILAEGASAPPAVGQMLYYQPVADQNVVHLEQDTVLALDKLNTTQTGADVVTETSLDLRAGTIFGSVKKLTGASKYEVKIPNGVAGVRGTVYAISADGVVTVISGSVVVAYAKPDGTVVTQVVSAGNQYDLRTGQMTPIPGPFGHTVSQAIREASIGPTSRPTAVTIDHTVYYISPVTPSRSGQPD